MLYDLCVLLQRPWLLLLHYRRLSILVSETYV